MGNYVSTYTFLREFLRSVVEINGVYRQPPSNLTTAVPLAVVARFGGADRVVTVDRPRVDIDWYASSEDTAETGAETIRTALLTHLRGWMYGGAVAGKVTTMSGPTLRDWDASGSVFRCHAAYELTIHQYTGVG